MDRKNFEARREKAKSKREVDIVICNPNAETPKKPINTNNLPELEPHILRTGEYEFKVVE